MKIQFIGTGGAFDIEQGNSSALLNVHEKTILIDCGYAVYPKLRQLNLVETIDAVLITHLHDDHVGSLTTLIFHLYFLAGRKTTVLFPDPKMYLILNDFLKNALIDPKIFVEFEELSTISGAKYWDTFGEHLPKMQTYGYYFQERDTAIAYSGDIGTTTIVESLSKPTFEIPKNLTVFHDTSFFAHASAHTYYKHLEPFLTHLSIIGYHHNPAFIPSDCLLPLIHQFPEYLLDGATSD
ncbi:MAG: MBL fold metallo-hydrolase [Bacteroidia bacterium]|nr:MBL fold metallo-hydrolase [Bacteroidia bacterium]